MREKISLYEDNIGSVEYVQHMGTDLTIVNSARVSFGKQKTELDSRDSKLIEYLIGHDHTSTLEHNVATFRFKVPLFVRSQHHRHRTWSFNEISRRYTDENLEFYEPTKFRTQHRSNRQASNNDALINPMIESNEPPLRSQIFPNCDMAVKMHHSRSVSLYNQMLEAGVCREQARGVLPQNLYTEYYGTCNLNNLIKFIDLRTHEGAQWEIQRVAEACRDIAAELWPVTLDALKRAREKNNE
jgi:thymidylate synthase (FAD)